MRSSRRVTQRVAPALASIASVLLFATCDFDKISGTPTPLSQQEIDRLFSITPTDTTIILGGTTSLTVTPGTGIDLAGTTQSWSSNQPSVVSVEATTGLATGLALGTATITARLLAPELDTGYSRTRGLRVRYKAIKACKSVSVCSPSTLDSIAGLNLSRSVAFFGTNNADQVQTSAPPTAAITTRDSGATTNTVVSVTGINVFARKNGVAYVIGVFEDMRDSIKVKVRQVAKSLTFPTTDYTATHMNMDRPRIAMTIKDVNDSVMTSSPVMRWSSSDPTVFTIDSLTGVLRVLKKDTARIFVRVDTVNRSQKLVVDQQVARLRIDAGNNQSDTVLFQLPINPMVTALDSGDTPVAGVPVTFRLGAAGKGANATITDSVHITDANGQATLGSWKLGPKIGVQTVRAVFGTDTSTLFVADAVAMRPSKLGFGVHPRPAASGAVIAPAVTVTVQDSLGNVTTATDSVSIAIGNNPSAATLSGAKKVAAVNGTATFSNLSISPGGPGFTLVATSGALTSSISDAFDVYGTATKLGVQRQPVSTSTGAILDTIQIKVMDANNTTIATAANSVTLAILNNAGTPSGTLAGTTTVSAVNGVATFTGLSINNAGNGYTLQATATGLTPVTTNAFNINPVGAAAKLAFSTQPPATFASGASQTIAVTVQDANGATVGSSTASVTISLVSSTTGASLGGTTLTQNAVGGVATFTGVTVNKVGTGFKVKATSNTLTDAESNAFSVTPGAAAKLAFIDQPTHTVVSTTMSPALSVAVQDANDNLVTNATGTSVSLSVFNCTGPTLTGTTSASTVSGVATFNALGVGPTTGFSCRLSATATGLTTGDSDPFSVVSTTGAIRLSFGSQPSNTTAGNSISSFTVRAVDQNGSVVTSAAPFITLKVLRGPGTVTFGASSTASSGIASFFNTQIEKAGTYKLLATATGFKPDSSVEFTINPATAFRLGFVQEPATITAGVPFSPAVAVAVQDEFGNTVTSFNASIELSRNSGPFPSSLEGGPTTVSTINGIATFDGLTIKKAGTNFDLFASHSGGSLFGKISSQFNVLAGPPAALGFTAHPTSFQTAGDLFNATVQAQDSVGNVLSNFTNQVTLALTGGDAAATLMGTTTMSPTSGSAAFTGLSVQKAGTNYRLNASASGLTTGQSNTFTVSAGNATKLGWLDTPQNTVQNAGIDNGAGGFVRVAAQDQYGNTNTNFFSTIRVSLGNNAGGAVTLKNEFGSTIATKDYSANQGVVQISNLFMVGSGNGVTLQAITPFNAMTSATSAAFDVAAFGSAAKLAFKQQPTNGTYAVALNPAVEVRIEDDFGNTVTNATNEVTLAKSADPSAGTATLSGAGPTAAVNGIATFPGLYLDKAFNGYSLQATASGLSSVTSGTFNITTPGVVTSGGASIADMARVGDRIYWLESGSIGALKSVAVTGGAVTTHSSSFSIANAARMATDGTSLYWIEGGSNPAGGTGSLRRYDIASGAAPTTMASGLFDVRTNSNTFAIDATNVYFSARNASGTTAAIRSVPLGATAATPADVYAPGANTTQIHYFTVDGGLIYFYDATTGGVKRMTTAGLSITPIANGVSAFALVVGGTTLYFTDGTNTIRTIPNASTTGLVTPGSPVAVGSFIDNMVIEGNNLYTKETNTVRRYDVTTFGGSATSASLATNGVGSPQTMLLDGQYLYYSSLSNGIGKVLK